MSAPRLETILGTEARAFDEPRAWWRAWRDLAEDDPARAAALGGAMAGRVGWAFAAGYEAALARLLPERDRARAAALCVTEQGPPHPRSIETTWDGAALAGEKRFVTLGAHADELLVLARAGERDGRPALVLVRVDPAAPGVELTELPAARFVPEIPHAAVRFDGARGEALEGDGWTRYVKPFRTVEDVHVHLALVAWLLARSRAFGFDDAAQEAGAALLTTLAALGAEDPSSPATHVALAGAIALGRGWIDGLDWENAPAEDRARWVRDRPLLDVAQTAREARRAKAWSALAAAARTGY